MDPTALYRGRVGEESGRLCGAVQDPESGVVVSYYDINTFVIDVNISVISIDNKRIINKTTHILPGTTISCFSWAFCVISKGKSR